ncbi:MAG: DUF2934 domain-containing protein [Phycisphaeraceae bacterium]|nr:DUF2934 domain-containing protein [Phycisphaeraceae bacterium]
MAKRASAHSKPAMSTPTIAVPAPKPAPATPTVAPKAPSAKPEVTIKLTHDQIAKQAYMIWLAKGKPEGKDRENWLDAISQLSTAGVK